MMLKRESPPKEGSRPAIRKHGNRAESSVFAVLAGVAVVCTGATAAALAGSHAAVAAASSSQCQILPAPSPSSSPSASPSGSGSTVPVSSTPNSTPSELCVAVSASPSSVTSGQDAIYSITVSMKSGTAKSVGVKLSAKASDSSPAVGTPAFTVCGSGDGSDTCTLGNMSTSRTTQLQAKVAIPASAPTGDKVTLSAAVTGTATGATSTGTVTGSASVSAVKPTPSPTPSNSSSPPSNHHHHHSGSGHHSDGNSGTGNNGTSGTTGNTNPLAGLPPLSTSGGLNPLLGSRSGDPGGLFPTINPSSGASAPSVGSTGRDPQRPYKASTVADVLPLNQGQLSAQVAGLIVLCIGIILVFARISLRKPKGSETKS